MIPYGQQHISQQDIDAVTKVLQSDFLTQGPAVPKFESAVADYCGADYACAVNSGTSALHLACMALGLDPGDSLWTSPNTFVASANCGRYCGAEVDFVDIDFDTANMSVEALKKKLVEAKKLGKLPKVLVVVHFAGQSCLMREIAELAEKYGFYVIEDACHAIGAYYLGHKVGSCHYSDMTVFSFHPVKLITSAEGGMIVTNNKELYSKVSLLRSHGITRDNELMIDAADEGNWYYQQLELGCNYRMSDIHAALGLSQLSALDNFVAARQRLVGRYNEKLSGLPLYLPQKSKDHQPAWHLYVIRLVHEKINKTRRFIFDQLRQADIGVNVHYIPVHTQPYYQDLGFSLGDYPEAERHYQTAITLPLYPDLTEEEQDFVISKLRGLLS